MALQRPWEFKGFGSMEGVVEMHEIQGKVKA
jgi:hypothetical protein